MPSAPLFSLFSSPFLFFFPFWFWHSTPSSHLHISNIFLLSMYTITPTMMPIILSLQNTLQITIISNLNWVKDVQSRNFVLCYAFMMYWCHVQTFSPILISSALSFFKSIIVSDDFMLTFMSALHKPFTDSNSPDIVYDITHTPPCMPSRMERSCRSPSLKCRGSNDPSFQNHNHPMASPKWNHPFPPLKILIPLLLMKCFSPSPYELHNPLSSCSSSSPLLWVV